MQKYVHNTVEGNNDYDEQPWFRHVDFPFVMTWFSFLAYLEMLYKSFGMQYQELQDQSNLVGDYYTIWIWKWLNNQYFTVHANQYSNV